MRLLAKALAGKASDFPASSRLFVLFVLTTFVVESAVMVVLPWLLPPDMPLVAEAVLDAALLTAILAPVVWRIFLVPLHRLHDDRGRLLERTMSAQEIERTRISRDLHDGLGQNLTSILLHLRVLEQTSTVEVARQHIETLRRIASISLDDLHRVVRETRPPVLNDLGLIAALEKQMCDVREISGIATTLECDVEGVERLPSVVETTLYRVVQEAATNAVRHSCAGQLKVTLTSNDDHLLVAIADDGAGFDIDGTLNQDPPPFGLLGIKERVRTLGGSVAFTSDAGKGTVVHVRVPLDRAAEHP